MFDPFGEDIAPVGFAGDGEHALIGVDGELFEQLRRAARGDHGEADGRAKDERRIAFSLGQQEIDGVLITRAGFGRIRVKQDEGQIGALFMGCLLYTSPSPRDKRQSRMPSSA